LAPVEVASVIKSSAPRLVNPHGPWVVIVLTGALLISIAWNAYSSARGGEIDLGSAIWTPEIEQLWRPFIRTNHALLLAFNDPTFAAFLGPQGVAAHLRITGVDQWSTVAKSPAVLAIQKSLGNQELRPRFDYVGRGDLVSAFLLGKFLGSRQPASSIARISQLSWQDLSENNVLLIGSGRPLNDKLDGLPIKAEFVPVPAGIRNLHPHKGEPEIFKDNLSTTSDGEVSALVSSLSGPVGNTNVEVFASNRYWGNTGAIQSFTDPKFARMLVEKLRTLSGDIPRYYQVLLTVKYRDGVTTQVSYVTHRALAPPERISSAN